MPALLFFIELVAIGVCRIQVALFQLIRLLQPHLISEITLAACSPLRGAPESQLLALSIMCLRNKIFGLVAAAPFTKTFATGLYGSERKI